MQSSAFIFKPPSYFETIESPTHVSFFSFSSFFSRFEKSVEHLQCFCKLVYVIYKKAITWKSHIANIITSGIILLEARLKLHKMQYF